MAIDMTKSTGLLVDSNEVAWLSTLRSSFSDFERLITSHRGRVLKFDGDSFLGVFDDIDDAIRAAAQIQKDLAGKADSEKLPPFRIALHSDRVYPLYAVKGTVEEASLNTPIDYVGLGVVSVYRMLEWINPRGIIISEKATSNARLGDLTEDLDLSGKQGLGPERGITLKGIPGAVNCHELMYTAEGFGIEPPPTVASKPRDDLTNATTFVGKIESVNHGSFKIRHQTQLEGTTEDRIFEVAKESVIGGGSLQVGGQVIFSVPIGDPASAIEVVTTGR